MSFKATNKSGAKEAFESRALYEAYSFPASSRNFWFVEHLLYGRVNTNLSCIQPKKSYMTNLTSIGTSPPVRVMDFVADAFRDLQRRFQFAVMRSEISPDSQFLSNLSPSTGAKDLTRSFDEYHNSIYKAFLESYLTPEMKIKIQSFEAFMEIYMKYLHEYTRYAPYTRSGYILNRMNSPIESGLCVEVADLSYSSDQEKYDDFIKDPNFAFFRVEASKRGFLVDKNAPWRLVADIASPDMLAFATQRRSWIASTENILNSYYSLVYLTEYEIFKEKTAFVYNVYARGNTNYMYDVVEGGEVVTKTNVLDTAPLQEIETKYKDDYWLKQFIKIKNNESKLYYSAPTLSQVTKKATDLYLLVDNTRGLGYIESKFRGFSAEEGSTAYEARLMELNKTGDTETNIVEELRQSFKRSKFFVY